MWSLSLSDPEACLNVAWDFPLNRFYLCYHDLKPTVVSWFAIMPPVSTDYSYKGKLRRGGEGLGIGCLKSFYPPALSCVNLGMDVTPALFPLPLQLTWAVWWWRGLFPSCCISG